jgi:hypothetical protein
MDPAGRIEEATGGDGTEDGGRSTEDGGRSTSRAVEDRADVSMDAKSFSKRMGQPMPPMLFRAPPPPTALQ